MVEKAHTRECHHHSVSVRALDDEVVADGASGFCNVFNTRLLCSLDIVTDRDECIGSESYTVDSVEICSLLVLGKGLGLYCEVLLPIAVCTNVLLVLIDISVDNIIAVGSAKSILKRQCKYLIVLTQKPCISLASRKSCTQRHGGPGLAGRLLQ